MSLSIPDHRIRTYSELITLPTFQERLKYLRLNSDIGIRTFGFERYINQSFYKSVEWKRIRNEIIVRDNSCDLAVDGYDICGKIYVHHMNPLDVNDIKYSTDYLLNPEYLICVSFDTHNAIHYGLDDNYLNRYEVIERKPNDTCPWRK